MFLCGNRTTVFTTQARFSAFILPVLKTMRGYLFQEYAGVAATRTRVHC